MKYRPSNRYTATVGRQASRALAMAWLNGTAWPPAMLLSAIVMGQASRVVEGLPPRLDLDADHRRPSPG